MNEIKALKILLKLGKYFVAAGLFFFIRNRNKKRDKLLERFYEDYNKEDYESALWRINKYIEEHPKDGMASFFKGRVLKKLNDQENLIPYFEKAIEYNKKHGEAHHELAMAHYNDDNYEIALKHFKLAAKYMKEDGYTHYFIGMSHLAMSDFINCEKSLKKALKREKGDKDYIYYGFYCMHKTSGDFAKMEEAKSHIHAQDNYF